MFSGPLSFTIQLRLICEWCLRGMMTNETFVIIVDGFQEGLTLRVVLIQHPFVDHVQ